MDGFLFHAFSVTDLREKDREADTLRRTTLFDSHFECCLPVPSADRSKILEETDMLSDRILSIVISDIEPIRFVSEYFRHLSYTARMYDYPTAEDRIAVLLGRLIRISEKNIISDKHLRIEADIRECRKLGNLYDTAQSLIGIVNYPHLRRAGFRLQRQLLAQENLLKSYVSSTGVHMRPTYVQRFSCPASS